MSELLDTVFFVLRKKYNQITFLHVYHHTAMPMISWGCTKYFPGGHGTFIGMINSFVHIIMYFYYMVAAMGPKYQKYLWWKKYITTLQMVFNLFVFLRKLIALSIFRYSSALLLFTVRNCCFMIADFRDGLLFLPYQTLYFSITSLTISTRKYIQMIAWKDKLIEMKWLMEILRKSFEMCVCSVFVQLYLYML